MAVEILPMQMDALDKLPLYVTTHLHLLFIKQPLKHKSYFEFYKRIINMNYPSHRLKHELKC